MNFPKIFDKYISLKDFQTDQIGKSNAGVFLFDDMVLKVQPESAESKNELDMLQWLNGKIPVPSIIEQISEYGKTYILMTRCKGHMSCADQYMKSPAKQAQLLAEALQQLWSIPIKDCPCHWPIEKRLQQASDNVASGNVDIEDAQPDTFNNSGFKNPEELLQWLIANKPEETAVISHGDFCLPNIFIDNTRVTGYIDLGKAGTADKWQDIALCYRSLMNNYNGIYGGKKYSGFKSELLFDALGIKPDWERIRYYILLDELF